MLESHFNVIVFFYLFDYSLSVVHWLVGGADAQCILVKRANRVLKSNLSKIIISDFQSKVLLHAIFLVCGTI